MLYYNFMIKNISFFLFLRNIIINIVFLVIGLLTDATR